MVVGYELEHHGKEGEETRSGYTEEEDISWLLFKSLTTQYEHEDEEIKRDP